MLLSNIRNWPQQHEADCLAACAAMVLDYLEIQRDYNWLLKILETSRIGTPFSNLDKLRNTLGVGVELGTDDTLATFAQTIELGLPVIVAVDSDDPELWPHYQRHAVVVIGFTDDIVFVNDPGRSDTQEIAMKTFMWAWSRRNYEYAVIHLEAAS